jgi:hypothetical protein
MPKPTFPDSPDPAGARRRMSFLVLLLVISNIATGLFSFYLLRSIDRRYSDLIDRSVPALNSLRELMTGTIATMRATNPRFFSGSHAPTADALAAVHAQLAAEIKLREVALANESFSSDPGDRAAIQREGEAFERLVSEIAAAYAGSPVAEVARLREEKLQPAFDRYVAAIGTAANAIETQSLTANRSFTDKTHSLSNVVLGIAGWPLIVGMALLLLTVIFVLVLMFMFRSKELGDMP